MGLMFQIRCFELISCVFVRLSWIFSMTLQEVHTIFIQHHYLNRHIIASGKLTLQ